MRMIQIQDNISEQKNLKDKLESEQEKLHVEYNKVSSTHTVLTFCVHAFIVSSIFNAVYQTQNLKSTVTTSEKKSHGLINLSKY